MTWADLALRIRALLHPRRVEQELDEELRFHLEMEARKNAASGAEAARVARVRFGGLDQVKEECRTVRGTQWIETSLRDFRYALRGFRRNPLFVLTVVGTISLGLGLNTALFTVLSNYVLRPISVRDPYSLYSFAWTNRAGLGHNLSWRDFEKFRESNPAFSDVLATEWLSARLNGHPMGGHLVTGNYFQMLGVTAHLGRVLLPGDAVVPGRDPVVVLSYETWQNKFGSDPDILGRKIVLGGYPLQVVGVANPEFTGLPDVPDEFWAPVTMAGQLEDGPDLFGPQNPERLRVVGRLRYGWKLNQAEAALTVWAKQLTADLPDSQRAAAALLQSQATSIPITPETILAFSPLIAAFGLVLLLACANVANLMLARAMARQREIGIRLSLGATRRRLIRQLLTEAVLLSLPAGLVGFAISRAAIDWGVRLMFATLPSDMAELIPNVSLPADIRVFAFMLVAALASAILFGLAPAIQSTRADVLLAARGEFTSDIRPMRLRNALVIGQITVCALLLICSAVCIRGARAIRKIDTGARTRGLIFMEFSDKTQSKSKILSRLQTTASVTAVASMTSIPLNGILPRVTISAGEGRTAVAAWHNHVSPEFFDVLEIPILEGRNFTAEEAKAGAPVAIISELAARSLWPKGDALGRQIRIQRDPNADWGEPKYSAVSVVGVARNIISCSIPYGPDPPVVYFPTPLGHGSLMVRVRGDAETVRRALASDLDAAFPWAIREIHPMDQAVALNIYPFRVAAWIGSALGGLALALTLSGIYGVLSYLITQRTREIGIRMALGSTSGAVSRLVLKQSGKLALAGIGLGTALALGVSRVFASHLVFINMFDLVAYGGGILLVVCATLAAAYIPSRRAARIDPVTTLRYD